MRELTDDDVIFTEAVCDPIAEWLSLREAVYTRLMLSRQDFVGKVMLTYAAVASYRTDAIDEQTWVQTDRDFLSLLKSDGPPQAVKAVNEWNAGELWPLTDLMWFEGDPPTYAEVDRFSHIVSVQLERECFAYRIKDKTTRLVRVRLVDGTRLTLGRKPNRWLLGVASPARREFTRADQREVQALAHKYLGGTLQSGSPQELELWG